MKRYLLLTLILILFSFTVGCGKNNATNTVTDSQTQNTLSSVSQPKEVTLDKESWKKLNIFFSNFSEAEVPPFERGKLTDDELILFGIRHNAHNNPNLLGKYPNRTLDKKYVESSVEKYFEGRIAKHETVLGCELYTPSGMESYYCTYKNGYYTIPAIPTQIDPIVNPGGEHPRFSQINKLFDNGNGTFTAYVNIYTYPYIDNFTGDPYCETPEQWKKNNKPDYVPTLTAKMKATIKKELDGKYILIDYLEDK